MSSKADSDLAQLGAELTGAIVAAIPEWITNAVTDRVHPVAESRRWPD